MLVNVLTLCVMLWALPASAYLTDLGTHTEPAAPSLPTAGSTAVDPTFGSTIMRLTDSGDSATDCMTIYSANPSFNVNSTKVAALCNFSGTYRLKVWDFNAATMGRSNGRIQSNAPSGLRYSDVQWSRTTYNKFYACSVSTMYEVTIPDGTSTTWTNTPIRDFAPEIGSGNQCRQGSISINDDVFVFHYSTGYLAWKRSTNTVLLRVANPSVNEVEIDKSGRYLVYCCTPSVVWDLQATPSPTSTPVTNQDFVHR